MSKNDTIQSCEQMLDYDVLKAISVFLKEKPDTHSVTVVAKTLHPSMVMTEGGKCRTGRIVVVDHKALTQEEIEETADFGDDDDDLETQLQRQAAAAARSRPEGTLHQERRILETKNGFQQ